MPGLGEWRNALSCSALRLLAVGSRESEFGRRVGETKEGVDGRVKPGQDGYY